MTLGTDKGNWNLKKRQMWTTATADEFEKVRFFPFYTLYLLIVSGLPADLENLEKPGNRKGHLENLEKGCNLPANLENSHKNLEKMFSVSTAVRWLCFYL